MLDYYEEKLSAERLRHVYRIASPRVRQYLEAEIEHVLGFVRSGDSVLELGCGYGRVLPALARKAARVVGIDTSLASLQMGRGQFRAGHNIDLVCANAVRLSFGDGSFDVVVCIQNGISAFHVDPLELMREAIRVTGPGGTVLFSTYSDRFWGERLRWFERQSEEGLLGEIDRDKTGNGVIVCRDGFTATTVDRHQFRQWATDLGVEVSLAEVDSSSLFCEIAIPLS